MTESEAIKICNTIGFATSFSNPKGVPLNTTKEELTEAMRMSIQALEKQIPKKPDCIEDKMWCCPVCDNNLLHKWIKYPTRLMPKSEGLPHCMSCGQAIDWSDEE